MTAGPFQFERLGIVAGEPDVRPEDRITREQSADAGSLEKGLAYQFPAYGVVPFGGIGFDVGAAVAIAAAASGWFGLARLRPEQDVGQAGLWTGYKLHQSPGDTGGLGDSRLPGPFGQWGDTTKAPTSYVVIGVNLPMQLGVWQDGPNFPGTNSTAGSAGVKISNFLPRPWFSFPTPNGNYASSTTRQAFIENKSPLAVPVTGNDTLDVALVMRATEVNAAVGKTLAGYIFGELTMAYRYSDRVYRT